jgi:[Skp1-protein]-hydroxyproline N-acetylglucosaminyltransferase
MVARRPSPREGNGANGRRNPYASSSTNGHARQILLWLAVGSAVLFVVVGLVMFGVPHTSDDAVDVMSVDTPSTRFDANMLEWQRQAKLKVSPGATDKAKKQKQHKPRPSRKEILALPQNRFPISVTTEASKATDWEQILHPAEESVALVHGESTENVMRMSVPKFWEPPSNNIPTVDGSLLTRAQAISVGSRIAPLEESSIDTSTYRVKDTIDHLDLDINPFDEDGLLETIFVMIASYRDDQCPHTVESIMERAHFPERVRIAIVDQRYGSANDPNCIEPLEPCDTNPHQALCEYKDRIDHYEMEAKYGVGPVFARHVGYRMYRGEYFAMQVDAHVFFVENWDVMLVDQYKRTDNEMAVMTTYLSDLQGAIDPDTHASLHEGRPIMCNTNFESGNSRTHKYLRNDQQPETWPEIKNTPQLAPYWAAGFSFGRGHFIVQVPYDQYLPMIFQGEEISIGLRGFTYGYDYYAPEFGVCFHMYANGENKAKRNKVKMFWENGSTYVGAENHSYDRLLGLIEMNQPNVPSTIWNHAEEKKYGLGTSRNVTKFFDLYGIHLTEQTVEQHLCRFVQNKMHTTFVEHLRPNGMGIDFSKVSYKFVDPDK